MTLVIPSTHQLRTELAADDLTQPIPGTSGMEQYGAPCQPIYQMHLALSADDLNPAFG
ncbi:hypothetical protein ABZS29_21475 [Kribbella sp. NPDC005582]|uniref:hypothetical protein n=1 Tax=Kribbella sp. NPDC005582 TaxID=3156893 RepID=UPI0033B141DE